MRLMELPLSTSWWIKSIKSFGVPSWKLELTDLSYWIGNLKERNELRYEHVSFLQEMHAVKLWSSIWWQSNGMFLHQDFLCQHFFSSIIWLLPTAMQCHVTHSYLYKWVIAMHFTFVITLIHLMQLRLEVFVTLKIYSVWKVFVFSK